MTQMKSKCPVNKTRSKREKNAPLKQTADQANKAKPPV